MQPDHTSIESPYPYSPFPDLATQYRDLEVRHSFGLQANALILRASAAIGMIAMPDLSEMHQEYEQNPLETMGAHDLFTRLAEQNIDWKGWMGVLGAVVIKNAGTGIARSFQRKRAIDEDVARIERGERSQLLNPAPEQAQKKWARRLGQGAITVASGVIGYKTGEHSSLIHETVAVGAALSSATVTGLVAEFKGHLYRKSRAKEKQQDRLLRGDYIPPTRSRATSR